MELPVIFKRLGFGVNGHKVYSALLRSKKSMFVSHIAKVADIDRPEVYRNLKQLLSHKFIKKVAIGKRWQYKAESPKLIEQEFKKTSAEAAVITKKLSVKRERELPAHIQYYKGFSGIRAIFDNVISHTPKGGTFYRYTSEQNLASVNRYLSPTYRLERDKKKLERLVISNPVSGRQKRSRLERFIKFIPPEADLFNQNIIQLVYADRLAFINLNTEEGFIIEDKALVDFQTVIFKQLYKKL